MYLSHSYIRLLSKKALDNLSVFFVLFNSFCYSQFQQDHAHEKPTQEDWYNSLSVQERKKIYRTGMQDNTEYFNDGLR